MIISIYFLKVIFIAYKLNITNNYDDNDITYSHKLKITQKLIENKWFKNLLLDEIGYQNEFDIEMHVKQN